MNKFKNGDVVFVHYKGREELAIVLSFLKGGFYQVDVDGFDFPWIVPEKDIELNANWREKLIGYERVTYKGQEWDIRHYNKSTPIGEEVVLFRQEILNDVLVSELDGLKMRGSHE